MFSSSIPPVIVPAAGTIPETPTTIFSHSRTQQVAVQAAMNVTMQHAAQISQQQLFPSSYGRDLQLFSHFVSRMLVPHEPQKLDYDQRKRIEFIRGIKVRRKDPATAASEKPKDQ